MDGIQLHAASPADIPVIAALAVKVWHQHYPSIIGLKQTEYMLEKMYSAEGLKEQFSVKQHLFYLISLQGNTCGFVSVHDQGNGIWFLNKFYIEQEKAAKGFGTEVYRMLVKLCRPSKFLLTVNRQNYKAINFYFKNGFRIQDVADFDIGGGYFMNDFVMVAEF